MTTKSYEILKAIPFKKNYVCYMNDISNLPFYPKGTLIPIGGNEDKGIDQNEQYTLDFVEDGILYHVVQESGGTNANILIIPTASSIPIEVGENYLEAFTTLGCKNVTVLDIRTKEDSEKKSFLNLVRSANCIMFSGGNQSKITEKIGGSALHKILIERYRNEKGFVIAGTSAGAMAMSEEMISGGSATESFIKGAVRMRNGLSLIPEIIIDTHFIRRGRFGRQSEAIAKFPHLLGIGLAEDTGVIIKQGTHCTVIGSGMAIIFDGSSLKHNNEKLLEKGIPMTIANMIVHVLSNSDMYDIKTRSVSVLPIEAPFI
jgi:cyanophycinase